MLLLFIYFFPYITWSGQEYLLTDTIYLRKTNAVPVNAIEFSRWFYITQAVDWISIHGN